MKYLSKIVLLLSALTLILLSGCRSAKQAVDKHESPDLSDLTGGAANFVSLIDSYSDWSELSVPLKIKLRQPASFSISGTLTMKKDSYIHFSARVLGMEVATVMITRDSIFAKEKLHKIYVAESFAPLTSIIPLNISNFQQIIFGHVFKPGAYDMAGRLKLDYDGDFWIICEDLPSGLYSISGTAPGNPIRFDVEASPCRIKTVASDFVNETPGPVASENTILGGIGDNDMFLADFSFSYSKARWSGVGKKSWETPSGYRRITPSELFKMLSTL